MVLKINHFELVNECLQQINENVTEKEEIKVPSKLKKFLDDLTSNTQTTLIFGTGMAALLGPVTTFVNQQHISFDQNHLYMLLISFLVSNYSHSSDELKKKAQELLDQVKKSENKKDISKIQEFLKVLLDLMKTMYKNTGKSIQSILDIFSFTSIFVPIMDMVDKLIKTTPMDSIIPVIISLTLFTSSHLIKKLFK